MTEIFMEYMVAALQKYTGQDQFWLLLLLLLGAIVTGYIRSKRYNLPPRPHGWPIIGNRFAINHHEPHKWLQELTKTHGPVFRVTLGQDIVVINDIKSAKEALVHREKDFSGRPDVMHWDDVSEDYHAIAFSDPDTHMWPQRRKLMVTALRKFTSGEAYEKRAFMTFGKLTQVLDEKANTGEAFNPRNLCKFYTFNQMGRICFSKTYDDPAFLKMAQNYEQVKTSERPSINDFLPITSYHLDLPDRRRAKKVIKNVFGFFKDEIQKHKERFTGKESGDVTHYIMKMMAEDETLSEITNAELQQLIAIDIFAAGVDTSENQLRCTLAYLAKYRDMQERVYEEILKIIGPLGNDDEGLRVSFLDQKSKMPYTEAFLLETIRFGTASVLGLPRKALCDTKIGEYDIPKGTQVYINQWAINYAAENEDPEVFRPERFLTDDGFPGPRPNSYLPFGLGRRPCPGETAAKNSLWMLMIMLLRRYEILPSSEQDFKIDFSSSFTSFEPKNYEIRLQYRHLD